MPKIEGKVVAAAAVDQTGSTNKADDDTGYLNEFGFDFKNYQTNEQGEKRCE